MPFEQWNNGPDSGWCYQVNPVTIREDRVTGKSVITWRDFACWNTGDFGSIEPRQHTIITAHVRLAVCNMPKHSPRLVARGYGANEPPHPQPVYGQPPPAQGYVANGPCFNYVPPKKFGDVKKHEGTNKWETSMLGAPCSEPRFCLGACCCPLYCAFLQRKKLLMDDWSRYVCCAGLCGDCNFCVCSGLETCCLCLEVWCCLSFAVHGNRFMVLQRYNLENDCCDLMVVWCDCCAYIAHLMDVG
ncbi:hypothetical protein TRVL_06184 [Trypanosoma vivax]|nr:hypothetical protein TRVL_06184 [Trypanosoma vivax]